VQPRSDEKRILSHIAVLEGAPALSENWSLFETNEALFMKPVQPRRQPLFSH
jgi:hypothetical protein